MLCRRYYHNMQRNTRHYKHAQMYVEYNNSTHESYLWSHNIVPQPSTKPGINSVLRFSLSLIYLILSTLGYIKWTYDLLLGQ